MNSIDLLIFLSHNELAKNRMDFNVIQVINS